MQAQKAWLGALRGLGWAGWGLEQGPVLVHGLVVVLLLLLV